MANTSSEKMGRARKAWKEMLDNPTEANLQNLKDKMNVAGASHKSLSGMETPMPKEFTRDYIHKTPKNLEKSLREDFGPDGRFNKSKLKRISGTSFQKSA